jgi:hypothetical protein
MVDPFACIIEAARQGIVAIFKMIVLASLLILLCTLVAGCTYARYTDDSHSLTILDLHPTGNTVNLDAALTGKGKLSLNRESGSAEGIVSEVGDMVSPNPLD